MVMHSEPLGRYSTLVLEFHEEERSTYGHSCIQRTRAFDPHYGRAIRFT